MTMTDILAIAVIVLVVGGATAYIIRAKKSGKKCIGCPDSGTCGKGAACGTEGSCDRCGGCSCREETK